MALLEGNQAAGQASNGGGIANILGGNFSAYDTTVMANTAYSNGGGLYNAIGSEQVPTEVDGRATATLDRVTLDDNSATDGGGIWNNALLNMVNCTVSFNGAMNGGGIYHANDMGMAQALLTHVTVADNEAEVGGQIFNATQRRETGDGASIVLAKSIVSVDWVPCDTCNAPVGSLGFNLDSANTCGFNQPTDLVNTLSGLNGALGAYGGLTMTRALDDGSAAIDHVTIPDPTITIDQRGKPRPFGPAADIGAYEFTQQFKLFAFKYGWSPVLCPSSTQRYTVLLWNSSALTQTNVVFTDTLPAGVEYGAATLGGVYDPQKGTVSWSAPEMSPYQWFMVEVTVRIPEDMQPGTEVMNAVRGTQRPGNL